MPLDVIHHPRKPWQVNMLEKLPGRYNVEADWLPVLQYLEGLSDVRRKQVVWDVAPLFRAVKLALVRAFNPNRVMSHVKH